MAVQREHAYERSSFVVDLGDGRESFAVHRVELPVATTDVITSRSGNDRLLEPQRRPGLVSYSHLVLHRGLVGRTDWFEWWEAVRDGEPEVHRNVTVSLRDEQRETVWSWRFADAFPAVYRFSDLDGDSSEPVDEVLELAFTRMSVD